MNARGAVEEQHGGSGVYGLRSGSSLVFGSEDNGAGFFSIEKCKKKTPETEFFLLYRLRFLFT